MKQGYEIQVQADLPTPLKIEATQWAQTWGENHKTGYGLGQVGGEERQTYYNRGSFGIWLDDRPDFPVGDSGLVFRRISRNRRIFGIVHVDTMERTDGKEMKIEQCMCPMHRGGQKVRFKERPVMDTVFTWGDIKG